MYDDICEYCDGSGHDPEGKGECPVCNVTGGRKMKSMSKRDIKAKPRLILFHGRWECGYISVRNGVMFGACDLDGTGRTPAEAYNRWLANNTDK